MPHIEQPPNRLAAFRTVVEGALVYIHPDKFVGEIATQPSLQGNIATVGFVCSVENVRRTLPLRSKAL